MPSRLICGECAGYSGSRPLVEQVVPAARRGTWRRWL
jgi:hypothetical protein